MRFNVSITLIPDELGNCRYTYTIRAQIGNEKWQDLISESCETWYIDGITAAENAIEDAEHFMAGFLRGFWLTDNPLDVINKTIKIDGQLVVSDEFLVHLN